MSLGLLRKRPLPRSLSLGGRPGPVVGPEGGHGEALPAIEVADRVVSPGVADGDRVGDLVRPDLDLVRADDLGFGLDELAVARGDREAARLVDVERLEAVADVLEAEDDLVPLLLQRLVRRAPVRDVDAVVTRQRPAGEAAGDALLVPRVDVLPLAQVD